jgi:membrane-associated phospholipid phosphatase
MNGNDTIHKSRLANTMLRRLINLALAVALLAGLMSAGLPAVRLAAAAKSKGSQVEPQAGTWKTWVLKNGQQYRLPAPPNTAHTRSEIARLKELAGQRNQAALSQIAYWNTGDPAYRWNDMAVKEAVKNGMPSMTAGRALALVHIAAYDATIAAWDSKYAYNRLRPADFDRSLKTVIATPKSPSYPSEHAVVAGAASEVLAYLFPSNANYFRQQADKAGKAMLLAGVQYPSDVAEGLKLGRRVAALVIERAKADGSDAPWDGTIPTGPGKWTGQNPALPLAGTWKTWVLSSGSELRPPAPPAYDSSQLAAEMAELKAFQNTPKTTSFAFFWEYGAGGTRNYVFWNELASRAVLENRMDANPPRAARVYALLNAGYYDSMVSCWDAKYTYWAFRPFQYDPTFQTLFKTPNHPSYPSAHSCLSSVSAEVLAYLFPRDAELYRLYADEAGESRIWGGIHFRSDVTAGESIGTGVAKKVIERAKQDGSK